MVPRDSAESNGFSEKKLSESRYLVTYSGPEIRTTNTIESQVALAASAARQTAYDLALRRAAEIATGKGYPALVIVHADNRLMQAIVGHDYRQNGNPVYDNVNGEALGYETKMYFRPETTLTVELLRQGTKGALDARAVAEEIKRKYAGATDRPIAPNTTYYFGPSAIVHNESMEGRSQKRSAESPGPHIEHPPYAGAAY